VSVKQNVPLVLALDDASAILEQVGGKGASLARLAAAGLPVPPGFHLTTAAYRRFITEYGLQEPILAAVSAITADQPAQLEEASQQIARLFAQHEMPADIADAVRQAYASLGEEVAVAVRSSATAEDLPEMSFAGQQETYLNMRGEAMVLEAVKRCWASLWTARAIGYRARQHIAPADVSLAVVVQQLVPADAAGILFTANPVTGVREQVMINAAWGLGEATVGGQVTPDTVVIDKASGRVLDQQISEKDMMTVRTQTGTREEPVPPDMRIRAVLTPAQATELARLSVQIEDLYGQPMDIEWALHDDRFFIVQARPITALPEAAPGRGQAPPLPYTVRNPRSSRVGAPLAGALEASLKALEWTPPNPKGRYIRSSVFELLPDPLSPLFATLGLPAWSRGTVELLKSIGLRGVFSDEVLVTINDYGFYDMTFTPAQSAKLVLALPGIIVGPFPRLMRTAKSRWQTARSRYAAVVDYWQSKDLASTEATNLLGGIQAITEEAAQYYLSLQTGILPAAYMSELFFTLVYNAFLKDRESPSALTFMLGFDSAPIRAEKSLYDLAQWVREQPKLSAQLANMSSEQFMTAYRQQSVQEADVDSAWPEFWRRLDDHLARFGHAIYDLDFAKAVLANDPVQVLETLKFFLSDKAPDPYQRQARAEVAREQATQTTLARLHGLRLRIFRRLLRVAQDFAPLREDGLADGGLGWPILRRMVHEIGRRLVNNHVIDTLDDVFWLRLDEVQQAANALDTGQPPADFHAIIAERRATWERERALTPPVALPLKSGARFLGIDFTNTMPARTDQPKGNVLKGVAASPGQVTGPAQVIHGPEEFRQMRQGDILVARITTPAWTPLFALASGIVTDVGGPLSHSSIVAREYHIPAVLGTGLATERLSSGQIITVDGDAGTVTIVGA
jgi:phosphohistidine swiveling domain-containing protein